MRRLYGRPATPITHKDFVLEVPCWRYIRPCGHVILYRIRIPWLEYGWCAACREPFQHDSDTREIKPRNTRNALDENKALIMLDEAIVHNRIADLLWALEAESISHRWAIWVARQTNSSQRTVERVAETMGLNLIDA